MVAPTRGLLKSIIDSMAGHLASVDNMRVYKYPTDSIHQFPAAVIRDNQAASETVVAEYRPTNPRTTYHLEVVILVGLSDEREAYEELEKYISADSPSSVKTLVDKMNVYRVRRVECIRAGPRRRYNFGGASLWGCSFWIRGTVA